MAMSEAQKRYRQNNPAHKKAEGEKRLDLIISGEAKQVLADKSKAAGMPQRQLLEALILSPFGCHTGVMVPTVITPMLPEEPATATITPVLSDAPSADSDIEARVLKMVAGGFRKGESSPVPKQVVELYNGDYREAAIQMRLLATRHKDTPSHESLQTLANRIDGSKPKIKQSQPKSKKRKNNDQN